MLKEREMGKRNEGRKKRRRKKGMRACGPGGFCSAGSTRCCVPRPFFEAQQGSSAVQAMSRRDASVNERSDCVRFRFRLEMMGSLLSALRVRKYKEKTKMRPRKGPL